MDRRIRVVLLALHAMIVYAALAAIGAGAALADTVATSGPATAVTSTSATLNGVIDPSDADSAWDFQIGPGLPYTAITNVNPVAAGLQAVSQTVSA